MIFFFGTKNLSCGEGQVQWESNDNWTQTWTQILSCRWLRHCDPQVAGGLEAAALAAACFFFFFFCFFLCSAPASMAADDLF
jgi:hypothetical protein